LPKLLGQLTANNVNEYNTGDRSRTNRDEPEAVVQFARKQSHPLLFRCHLYRRGICLLPAAKQQIPRSAMPRFGMTIPLGVFKLHHNPAAARCDELRATNYEQRIAGDS
jgi:hypothetical protein